MGEIRVTMTRKMHGVCYWITGEIMCCRKKLIDLIRECFFLDSENRGKMYGNQLA
jgi:hypothetical protein